MPYTHENETDWLFDGSGEMRALCRSFDWTTTPLGHPAQWPHCLRTAVQMTLSSPFPNIVLWGAGLTQIYNDSYADILTNKHPAALGLPTEECWPEVWHINKPIYDRVWKGESFKYENAVYPLIKHGILQDSWLTLSYSPIKNESGAVGGILVTVFDNTERVLAQRQQEKAEQALYQSEQRLAVIFESLPIGVAEIAPDGKVIIANKAMDRYMPTGIMPSKDDKRRGRWAAWTTEGAELEPDEFPGAKALRGERTFPPIEMRYLQDNGSSLWTHVSAVPIYDADGKVSGQVTIVADIDNLKKAEEKLQQADKRKDEFLAMLAHELRNPLATIHYGLSMIAAGAETDGESWRAVPMMKRQADHLIRLVDDLLDLSRITQNKIDLRRESVELGGLVSDAIHAIQYQFEQTGKQLHFASHGGPVTVIGDATRLNQIVTNLLINGLRYTDEHGSVWVELTSDKDSAIICVRDNGIGLPAHMLTSIFDLFVQADNSAARSKGGLGIGLTLVKRLAKLHGGDVEARSGGINEGTEIIVRLPVAKTSENKTHRQAGAAAKRSSRNRVLIIDDNKDAAYVLCMLLAVKGYDAECRFSGPDGIRTAQETLPDAIVCDIGMPGMNGFETARLIRQQSWGRSIVLIALTGYGQQEDKKMALEAGFDAHFVKPVDIDVLAQMLERRFHA